MYTIYSAYFFFNFWLKWKINVFIIIIITIFGYQVHSHKSGRNVVDIVVMYLSTMRSTLFMIAYKVVNA